MHLAKAQNLVLRFGRHRGRCLRQVAAVDRDYLVWLRDGAGDAHDLVRRAAAAVLESLSRAPAPAHPCEEDTAP